MYLFTNHYEVLGVPETASPDEVREAYRAWVRRTHPGPDFVAGNEAKQLARDVLCDPARREAFDRELAEENDLLGSVRAPRIRMNVASTPARPTASTTSTGGYAAASSASSAGSAASAGSGASASAMRQPSTAGPAPPPAQVPDEPTAAVPSSPRSHKIVAAAIALALWIPTVLIGLDLWRAYPGAFTSAWHTPAYLALAAVTMLASFRAVVVLAGYRGLLDWSEWSLYVGRYLFTAVVAAGIVGGIGYVAANAETLVERRYLSEIAIGVAVFTLLLISWRALTED